MNNYIRLSLKDFIKENNSYYKEIEFVCHNSDSENSTDKNSQKKLYDDLKKLEVESDFKIKPYMQDFSEDDHIELSLAVIILDKENEKYWENEIMSLSDKHGVEFDLYNNRSEYQVNSIIRGDYYDNII
jgi:hypothetical protein